MVVVWWLAPPRPGASGARPWTRTLTVRMRTGRRTRNNEGETDHRIVRRGHSLVMSADVFDFLALSIPFVRTLHGFSYSEAQSFCVLCFEIITPSLCRFQNQTNLNLWPSICWKSNFWEIFQSSVRTSYVHCSKPKSFCRLGAKMRRSCTGDRMLRLCNLGEIGAIGNEARNIVLVPTREFCSQLVDKLPQYATCICRLRAMNGSLVEYCPQTVIIIKEKEWMEYYVWTVWSFTVGYYLNCIFEEYCRQRPS